MLCCRIVCIEVFFALFTFGGFYVCLKRLEKIITFKKMKSNEMFKKCHVRIELKLL